MSRGPKGLTRFVAIFAGGTMLSRVLGLVRDIVIANYVPFVSREIFLFAFRFPNMLRDMLGEGAVNAAFVPLFARSRETDGEEAFRRLVRACLGAMLLLFAVVCAAGLLFVPLLPGVLALIGPITGANALDPAHVELGKDVLYWLVPYFFLIGAAVFAMGPLFVVNHYSTPSWSPVILNVAIIAVVLLHRDFFPEPVWALVAGVWLGGIGQVLVMFRAMKKHTGVWLPSLELGHPGVRHAFLLLAPVIVGQATGEVNKLVDSLFAFKLEAVQYLYFSNRLVQLPLSIFGIAVAVSILPAISAAGARDDRGEIRETLVFGLRQSAFLVMPALVGLLVLGEPIMRLLFVHPGGDFTVEHARHSANAMFYLAWGLIAFTWVKVAVQGFFAVHDTKSPVIIATLSMGLNIVLNIMLVRPMGYEGLALATTLSYAANFLGLFVLLNRRYGSMITPRFMIDLLKIVVSASVMGAVVYGAYRGTAAWLGEDRVWAEVIVVSGPLLAGVLVYPVLGYFLRVEDARQLPGLLRRATRGRRG